MANPVCSACGTATEPGARFCGVCGTKIESAPPTGLDRTMPDLRPVTPRAGSAAALAATTPLQRPPAIGTPVAPAHHSGGALPVQRSSSPAAGVPVAHSVGSSNQHPVAALNRSISPTHSPAHQSGGAARAPALAQSQSSGRIGGKPTLPSLDRLMGRTLNGRYLVERKIGEGGFGAVFRGRQVATGREVALKILHPHNVADATVVARFRREAEACSKLTNPHTVTIYDFDETEDGILYLAMELLRGRPLQDVARAEGPFDARRTLSIMSQVAEALGEAHMQGIVHRDMKPENVMLELRDGEDYVKVLDFGIAKIGDASGKGMPALTAVGQTLGTLEFMSPEQLRGKTLDGRSDLYALGIMAYEMLTGLLPWREAKIPIEVIKFHLETIPPVPSALRKDLMIPRPVDDLVHKMVAKDPRERFTDAAELRHHIDVVQAQLARKQGRGHSLKWVGIAAGVAVLATAVGLALLR